jgi:hypothetical protein
MIIKHHDGSHATPNTMFSKVAAPSEAHVVALPPLAVAQPLEEPAQVVIDEIPLHRPDGTLIVHPLEIIGAPIPSEGQRFTRRIWRMYFWTGTAMGLVGVSFLIVVTLYFAHYLQPNNLTVLRDLDECLLSQSHRIDSTSNWNVMSMTNDTVVGLSGSTILETHNVLAETLQVQYFPEVLSLELLPNDRLAMVDQDSHIQFYIRSDVSRAWQRTMTLPEEMGEIQLWDAAGDEMVLWTKNHVLWYWNGTLGQIMANWPNEQVVDVSISSFHHEVYLGLSGELRVMARHKGQWTVRDSLWLAQPAAESDMKPTAEGNMNANDGSAGRRDIEDVLKTVQVSGKTVAIQTTQGGLQLYYCPRYGDWEPYGGDYQSIRQVQDVILLHDFLLVVSGTSLLTLFELTFPRLHVAAQWNVEGGESIHAVHMDDNQQSLVLQVQVYCGNGTVLFYQRSCKVN